MKYLALISLVTLAVFAGPSSGRTFADTVTITSGPSNNTTATTATFTFTGTGAVTDFRCLLDNARIASVCSSPTTYSGLALGGHTFTVYGYRGSTAVGVSDSRRWNIVASPGPGPGPGPGPPPGPAPPPPPPVFGAKLVTPVQAPPGGVVTFDASGSTGDILQFLFDIDGNGSYETKCGKTAKASAAYGQAGTYKVGVLTIGAHGEKSSTSATFQVTGAPVPGPAGKPGLTTAAIVGGCQLTDQLTAAIKAYECPTTVHVGVGEAIFPPGTPPDVCFKRSKVGGKETFTAPKGQTVQVNGLEIHIGPAYSVVIDATAKLLTAGSGYVKIADPSAGFAMQAFLQEQVGPWSLAKPSVVDELSFCACEPLLGLRKTDQTTPLSLTAAKEATLDLALVLPQPLDVVVSSSLRLRTSNTSGPILDNVHLEFGDIPLGGTIFGDAFLVKALALDYAKQGMSHVWSGKLTMLLPPASQGIVATGGIVIRDGTLEQASLALDKGTPGYGPLGCCIYMTHLGGTLASDHIGADVTLTAGPAIDNHAIASLAGDVTVYWSPHFMLQSHATLYVVDREIGSAFVYAGVDEFSLWGSIDEDFLGVFNVDAKVGGGIWSGGWYLYGGGTVCVSKIDLCAGGKVAVATKGLAGCGSISTPLGTLAGGGVYYWSGGAKFFTGCGWGLIKGKVGAPALLARRTTAEAMRGGLAGPQRVRVAPGLESALFRITGVGGAPRVALEGPGGRRLTMPGPTGTGIRKAGWYAVQEGATTYVAVAGPAAGTWTVTALPGSPAIAEIGLAEPLPERLVTGSVVRTGGSLALRYRVAAGLRATFVERAGTISRVLGRRTGSGTIVIAPTDGPRRRVIVATAERDGIPLRTETIAQYAAPSPIVLRAPRVTAERRDDGVLVSWSRIAGAKRYLIELRTSDGHRRLLQRRGTSLSLPANGRVAGLVAVRGLAGTKPGRAGRALFTALPDVSLAASPLARVLARTGALTVRCVAGADGVCSARLQIGGRTAALGVRAASYGRPTLLRLRLSTALRKRLVSGTVLRIVASVPGRGTRVVKVVLR
jgi:hypothetical protein